MKRVAEVSMVFCGAVIGAGFASGREILSYFASYSLGGILGAFVLFFAFVLCVNAVLQYCFHHRIYRYSDFLAGIFSPVFHKIITVIVTIFLFSSFFVMASGCGALLHEQFGWNRMVGILLLVGISFFVLLFDLKGLTKMNVILTPVLLAGIILISLSGIFRAATPTFMSLAKKTVFNPFSSSLIYVSYNMLLATAVLVPLAHRLKNAKEAWHTSLVSGLILFITTFVVYLAMYFSYLKVLPFEIPLLHLSSNLGKGIEIFYGIVMIFAMLTSAVAAGYGFMEKMESDFKIPPKATLAGMCILSVPFASMGFANLIDSLYGFFGLIGLAVLFATTWKCIRRI